MNTSQISNPKAFPCLCKTHGSHLCPKHKLVTDGARAAAYVELAQMCLFAVQFGDMRALDSERINFLQDIGIRWTESQNRIAFAFPVGMSLREGIDAALARGEDD